MICVLINTDDNSGLWLARSLKQRCAKPVKVITAEELVYAPFFSCGFKNGQAFFTIRLHTDLQLCSSADFTFLNRISYLPDKHLAYFKEVDRDYVRSEQQAVFTFLFSILPNSLFNMATGRGLSGVQRSLFEWKMLARQVGFRMAETVFENKQLYQEKVNSTDGVFYLVAFRGKCYGKKTADCAKAGRLAIALQERSSEKILEVGLQVIGDDVFFETATITPGFRDVNESFLNDLQKLL